MGQVLRITNRVRGFTNRDSFRDFKSGQKDYKSGQRDFKSGARGRGWRGYRSVQSKEPLNIRVIRYLIKEIMHLLFC